MNSISEMETHRSVQKFWTVPLPKENIYFVDSTDSEAFELLLFVLEHAFIIGLDAEWKPVTSPGAHPKVSILQIACRLSHGLGHRAGSKDNEENDDRIWSGMNQAPPEDDLIFIVDILMIPPSALVEPLKKAFKSSKTLKLGFKLRQDLINLAASFTAKGCFGKVEPYIDIGKLYREVRGVKSYGRRLNGFFGESAGLASICEEVLGLPLCKELQCSNWEQRPLTQEQIAYAAADAHCLLAILDALQYDMDKTKAGNIVGIAQLLYPIADTCISIKTRFGSAKGSQKKSNCESEAGLLKLLEACGEALLIDGHEPDNKRKARNRRIRDTSNPEWREDLDWHGPAPWDPAAGGDGSPKFLCDIMIEGLARLLRCVGIDAACPHGQKPNARQLVEQAEKEGRVLLTRDVKLLRQRLISPNHAYRVKNLTKKDQLTEVIETFKLTISEDQLLSRCTKCNGHLLPEPLTAEQAKAAAPNHEISPEVASQDGLLFWQCSECKHLYWQGLQFRRAMKRFSTICSNET